jgi:hypothetical protein
MQLILTIFVAAIALIFLFLISQQYITGGVFWIAAESNKGRDVSLYVLAFIAIALLLSVLIFVGLEIFL